MSTVQSTSHVSVDMARSRRLLVGGIGLGLGVTGLVLALSYWAAASSAGRQPSTTVGTSAASTTATTGAEHAETAELPPEVAARVGSLQSELAADPDNLAARKELALVYVENEFYVTAIEHAAKILKLAPEDPDGLYVEAIVRMKMGQNRRATDLLDRVLAQHPNHVAALEAKGLVQLRTGDTTGAVATWERGLAAAGGQHPELERLLAVSRSASNPSMASSGDSGVAGGVLYQVEIDLSPEAVAARGATLFVSLLGDGAGPPVAVKRLHPDHFPVDVTLTSADSMLGESLPEAGTLVVRLDGDGNASTRLDTDPEARALASGGSITRLVLR